MDMEDNSSVQVKQKKTSTPPQQVVILHLDPEDVKTLLPRGFMDIAVINQQGFEMAGTDFHNIPYEVRMARLKKSEEEKRESRRLYTKEYTSRPNIQEKIKARLEKPETQEKRKAYAARDDVKERKRLLAQRKRQINAMLKKENPDLYSSLQEKVVSSIFVG